MNSKKLRRSFLTSLLTACSLLGAFEDNASNKPWFTGPLLAPSSSAVEAGHAIIQPYVFYTRQSARYDDHWKAHAVPNFFTTTAQLVTIIGLTENMDIQLAPQAAYNHTDGKNSGQFGDLPVGFDFQVRRDDGKSWKPSIKFTVREIFPTGRYERLDPSYVDIGGTGSYVTQATLVFHKLVQVKDMHYLSMRFGTTYSYFAPVSVRGFNAFGGSVDSRGKVRPGSTFSAIFSFEYSFDQRWAFAMDTLYYHTNRDHFSGTGGFIVPPPDFVTPGIPAVVGTPSSELISFAPAIEYNFTKDFGLLGGVWFTAWGRNSPKFFSFVFSAIYAY